MQEQYSNLAQQNQIMKDELDKREAGAIQRKEERLRREKKMEEDSLKATCEGQAMAIVEKAGAGEGLETWRLLLSRYEAQTRQSRVMIMIQILSWDFKTGELLDSLEAFDRACQRYTEATKK